MKNLVTAVLTILAATLFTPVFAEDGNDTDATQAEAVLLYVDINGDDAETLSDLLKGVGMKKAEAIISYRDEFGPFTAVEDLLNVPGIGPATLEKNRAVILLGDVD